MNSCNCGTNGYCLASTHRGPHALPPQPFTKLLGTVFDDWNRANVRTQKHKRLARVVVHENGKKAITGNQEALKESQTYPVRFALELVKLTNPDAFT